MSRATWPTAVVGGSTILGLVAARSPLAALLAVLGLAVTISVWRAPAFGAALLLGLVPASAGIRRGLPLPGVRPAEAAIAVLAGVVLVRLRGPRPDRIDLVAALYATAVAVLGLVDLLVVRGDPISGEALQVLGAPVGMLLVYRACRVAFSERRALVLGLRLALAAVPLVAASAVAQEVGVPGARGLLARLTAGDGYGPFGAMLDQGVARATGPFEHPQTLGAYLAVMVVLTTALLVRDRSVASRPVLAAVVVSGAAGIAATVTAGTAAFALVGALLVATRAGFGRKAFVAGGALAATAVALAAPRILGRVAMQFDGTGSLVPQSLRYRLVLWRDQFLPAIRGHWLTGYGPGFPARITFPYAESLYVALVFRGGLVLLAVYAVLLFLAVRAVRGCTPSDGVSHALRDTFLVVALLLVPLHVIGSYWLDGGVGQLWWALLAAALATGSRRAVREDG